MNKLLLTIVLCLWSSIAWGRAEQSAGLAAGIAGFDTNIVFQTLDNGYLRTTVTNYGYFGTVRDRLKDSTGAVVPVLESPPHSGIEYLFEAGLWIGGVVGIDTLVSSGMLGYGQAHELYADNYSPGVRTDRFGDDEWTFVYGDTTTEPETVRDDIYDGPHRPLPVRVRQTTYTFDGLLYNQTMYTTLVVTNVGSRPITDAWFGWLIDPDIGHVDRDRYYLDDLTGHTRNTVLTNGRSVDVSVAWAMDNDGDPDSTGNFGSRSAKRALGSMFLGASRALASESYNWWVPSLRKEWDWGPQRAPGDTNVVGGHGIELTDAFRYRLMSNGEIDYPQPFAGINKTSEGWIPPPADSIAFNFADGYDIRFLHSVGPATLAPGDSIVIEWVWCVAPYAHTNPWHFIDTFDPTNPQPYVDGLGIDALELTMAEARVAWDSAFSFLPIAPPERFQVTGWNDTSGVLTWSPRHTDRLTGYQLYRERRLPGGIRYAEKSYKVVGDTSFVDYGLDRSQTYYYAVSSLASPGATGPRSIYDSLLPDRPRTPAKPVVRSRSPEIIIEWTPNPEPDILEYLVYRRLLGGEWELLGETVGIYSLADNSHVGATVYEYRITALSQLLNESYPSPSSTGIAFSFDGPPQILDYTSSDAESLTDKDSVAAAWLRILENATYRDASEKTLPYPILDFDPHPVTIVVSDGRLALPSADFSLLNLYSNAQGATIISGRDLFNTSQALDSLIILPKSSIGYMAGIRKAYYPRSLLANPTRMNAEFIGARPVDRKLPRLDVDSTRTDWGLNPALPNPGRAIPFVGYFEVDTSLAEVIYTYESNNPQSPLQGKPVAVISKEPGRTLAVFAFPLSYIEEADAKACVAAVLRRMGYGSALAAGDANSDGSVTAADVVFLVNYLYRDGYLIDERGSDVNGDCRVDLLDVVYLADHVYRGVELPGGGCSP